jgi:two-component system response regulator DesR
MIRVLLAEDQAMVRGALAALLELERDIDVVAVAADGEEAWRLVRAHPVDVIVTDIEMPVLGGLELAQRVRDAGLRCKVVIVTTWRSASSARRTASRPTAWPATRAGCSAARERRSTGRGRRARIV